MARASRAAFYLLDSQVYSLFPHLCASSLTPKFEGGLDTPRFLASEWFVGIRAGHVARGVRSASHPGVFESLVCAASICMAIPPHTPNARAECPKQHNLILSTANSRVHSTFGF